MEDRYEEIMKEFGKEDAEPLEEKPQEENQAPPEATEEKKDQPEEEKGGVLYDIYALLHDLVYILAAITLIFVFFVRLVGVNGGSMLPTLQDSDYLALQSNVIMGNLKYGDIIVARKLEFREGEPIVKRVIATEGQTVRIDYDDKNEIRVYVDGVVLNEPYIREMMEARYAVPMEVTVDKDCVFVMGDNRNNSADSRFSEIGQIKLNQVLGKVLMIVLPGKDPVTGSRDFGRIGSVS
ncbi:MAG: signal peptidase I [Oscillospiraceae bacterium]|nr:signal peptidase I [Oscillospiraceae bacterium]